MKTKFRRVISLALCLAIVGSLFIGISFNSIAGDTIDTLMFTTPEVAGISGFRDRWDAPLKLNENGLTKPVEMCYIDNTKNPPTKTSYGIANSAIWDQTQLNGGDGAIVFDAIHRSMLVKFPGISQQIATKLKEGKAIKSAKIQLVVKSKELWPEGYWNVDFPVANKDYSDKYGAFQKFAFPTNNGDKWLKMNQPENAQAYLLRKPWSNDKTSGPTFNANVNGVDNWAQFGAKDTTKDRYPTKFAQEKPFIDIDLSDGNYGSTASNSVGNLDITTALTDSQYGDTLEKRLMQVEQNGFIVNKQELYEQIWKEQDYYKACRGGQGYLINTPKLIIEFESGPVQTIDVSKNTFDLNAYKQSVITNGTGGARAATMPSVEQINAYIEKFKPTRLADMPDWQWGRVSQAISIDPSKVSFAKTLDQYYSWVDTELSIPFRDYRGFDMPVITKAFVKYKEAMPPYLLYNRIEYWKALLNAGQVNKFDEAKGDYDWGNCPLLRPTNDFNQELLVWVDKNWKTKEMVSQEGGTFTPYVQVVDRNAANYNKEWRGYQNRWRLFTWHLSTMNFNLFSTNAFLIGSAATGDKELEAEARRGFEKTIVNAWGFSDGSNQEAIDHYYFAITFNSAQNLATYAPTEYDRILARGVTTKFMDILASSWHPGIKRFISNSNRTGIEYPIMKFDGIQGIMHSNSKRGAYTDVVYNGSSITQNNPTTLTQTNPALPIKVNYNGVDYPVNSTSLTNTKTGATYFSRANQDIVNISNVPLFASDATAQQQGTMAERTLETYKDTAIFQKIIDKEIYPYYSVAADRRWKNFSEQENLYTTSYLGKYYGLASIDLAGSGSILGMAQWIRNKYTEGTYDADAKSFADIGTMMFREGVNDTRFDTRFHGTFYGPNKLGNDNGSIMAQGNTQAQVQYKNKALFLYTPDDRLTQHQQNSCPIGLWSQTKTVNNGVVSVSSNFVEKVQSIQGTLAFYNFQNKPVWKIYVDGVELSDADYPKSVNYNQKITIWDGTSYIAVTPIQSTTENGSLRRNNVQAIIEKSPVEDPSKVIYPPLLMESKYTPVHSDGAFIRDAIRINSYVFYDKANPIPISGYASGQIIDIADKLTDWKSINQAVGGFAVEMGDVDEYGSYDNFYNKIKTSKVEVVDKTRAATPEDLVDITFTTSDNNVIKTGIKPSAPSVTIGTPINEMIPQSSFFAYRTVNGKRIYPEIGIDRDTTNTVQSRLEVLEKNGTTLKGTKGVTKYLIALPNGENVLALNPTTERSLFDLKLADGKRIRSNVMLGATQVLYDKSNNELRINYANKPGTDFGKPTDGLMLYGIDKTTKITINDVVVSDANKFAISGPALSMGTGIAVNLTPNGGVPSMNLYPIKDIKISLDSPVIKVNEKQKIIITGTRQDGTPLTEQEIASLTLKGIFSGANPTGIKTEGQYIVGVNASTNGASSSISIEATLEGVTVTSNKLEIVVYANSIPLKIYPSINATAWFENDMDCCRPGTHDKYPNIKHQHGEKDCPFNIAANKDGISKGLTGNQLYMYVEQQGCDGAWFQNATGAYVNQLNGKYLLPKRTMGYVIAPYDKIFDGANDYLPFPNGFGSQTLAASSICDAFRVQDGIFQYSTGYYLGTDDGKYNMGTNSAVWPRPENAKAAYGASDETRVIIDLGEQVEVTNINYTPHPKCYGKYVTYYQSNDAQNWIELANIQNSSYIKSAVSTPIPSTKFRYLRVVAKYGYNDYTGASGIPPAILDVLVTAQIWIEGPSSGTDKTILNATISTANAKVQSTYTSASWEAFQAALTTAKTIQAKELTTKIEVDNATTTLNNAINNLANVFSYTTINTNQIEITKYNDTLSTVSIQSVIDGKPVTSIASGAFSNIANLTVTIPKTVTIIATDAFANPTDLTIKAFKGSYPITFAIANNIKFVEFSFILGDPNADSKIDGKDIAAIVMHITKVKTLADSSFSAGDVNKDGKIDGKDIAAIVMHITKVKLITG